jgi:hypothetical protein
VWRTYLERRVQKVSAIIGHGVAQVRHPWMVAQESVCAAQNAANKAGLINRHLGKTRTGRMKRASFHIGSGKRIAVGMKQSQCDKVACRTCPWFRGKTRIRLRSCLRRRQKGQRAGE